MNSTNSLSVNSTKSLQQKESLVTTKELADVLGVEIRTINNAVKRLEAQKLLECTFQKTAGRPTKAFTEEQATLIKQEIQKHHNLANRQIDNVSTELEENETVLKALSILKTRSANLQKQYDAMKNRAELAEEKLIEVKSDVEFSQKIQSTNNVLKIGEIAKILELGYGSQTLFKKLVEMKILMQDHLPYQEYINRKYFKVCVSYHVENDKPVADKTTKVYMKGAFFIAKKLGVINHTKDICEAYGVTDEVIADDYIQKELTDKQNQIIKGAVNQAGLDLITRCPDNIMAVPGAMREVEKTYRKQACTDPNFIGRSE